MIGFFYGQTEYNYLENAIPLSKYVETCASYGYTFATITDKNMHGYYKFYNLCLSNNIKPVIGLKVQLSDHDNILVYAKNDNGLKTLFKLSKLQETKKDTVNILNSLTSDVFLVIPDDSLIHTLFEKKEYEKAKAEFSKYKCEKYIGLNSFDNELDRFIQDNNINVLPISNCNYLEKNDYNVYKTLVKIGNTNEKNHHTHLLNVEEFNSLLGKYAMNNKIVEGIEYNLKSKISLPIYSKDISNSNLYLRELSNKGLQRRLQLKNKVSLYNKYFERLSYELDIIQSMGYDDYFLIVWDLIKYSKKEGILVGPGRGSAAGSLVSYCLGITEIDPLEYDLYFERFLNPDRITMPDIDIDFPDNKREEVIQYVKNKYGEDHVCYISAFNTFGVKSSIRDICRVNNVNVDHASLMLKFIEENGISEAIKKYESRSELLEVLQIANKMNGLIRHISTHAAGVILSSVKLDDFLPLRSGINGVYQSQLEASDLEKIGFLKIDFLGIRNLSLINNMINDIGNIKLNEIKLNDKKTFELLQKGDTNGIFQLESSGIKNVLKKLKPTCFDDIVSVLALYRPGPMDNIDSFIEGKKTGKVKYLIKELEPILKHTYGIIVYQEQIMEIANVICDYSYAQADLLRRAVSKKDKDILDENRKMFTEKASKKGYDESISNQVYDLIVKFADYGFNKSHSVAYAKLSYEMAFLKANYPVIFISEMLNNAIGDDKEMISYINYAKINKIEVVTPKVNHSNSKCIIFKNRILLPFQAIHKIGINTSNSIVEEREKGKFESFEDFKDRTEGFINSVSISNLIFSSVFDEFNNTKKSMNEKTEVNSTFAKYVTDTIDDVLEYDFEYLKDMEKSSIGFNMNYDIFKNNQNKINKFKIISNENEIMENKKINTIAYLENVRTIETKNKEQMAFVDLDLNFIKISGVVFPSVYDDFLKLNKNQLILIEGNVQKRNDEYQIVINKAKNI
ncbi:MAG: DNA polymerase III subunit alpha [bacterium]